jgi:uncharacterized protein (DUF1684 family)
MRRIVLPLVIAMFATGLGAAEQSRQEKWKADIADANAAWATNHLAILKIDHAIYIKPGERAWLVRTGEPNGKVHWSLTPKNGALVEASYEADKVELRAGQIEKKFVASEGSSIAVNADIDVRAQLTQMAPDQMGVRLFAYNQRNPEPKAFKGLDYFAYNPSYAVVAAFEPETAKPVDFETSRGWVKRFWRVGVAHFALNGADIRLPLYGDTATPKDVSSFFTDATTGKTTYGVGRYVDSELVGAFPPKTLTIDFNEAYNPNCARSQHYNCPYATDHLPIAVEAGEKAPPAH